MKLWTGRLSDNMDALTAKVNNSLAFDQRLAQVDVQGSQAWSLALYRAGLLSAEELQDISSGLATIQGEFDTGRFIFKESDEDIHTAVERRLIELIGTPGFKLHTGRSRNDQVATDFCLWLKETAYPMLSSHLLDLQKTLVDRAELDFGIIIPGYTHLQQAQPILLSHWWLSYFWPFERDRKRLGYVLEETAGMPLGSAALAGTGFDIDRFKLANDLGFSEPSANSIDAVSNRDYAVAFLYWAALCGVHISRLAESLILYSSQEYGYLRLADSYVTGSSLMPQKRNPDILELARAKSAILTGELVGFLGVLKGLPSAYDKDLQEDKVPVFRVFDVLCLVLPVMSGMIRTLTVNSEKMRRAIDPQTAATGLADYLVRRGVPFREAYRAISLAVGRAEEMGIQLSELPLSEWQQFHSKFDNDVFECFNPEYAMMHHIAWGGTAPQAVKQQIAHAKNKLVVL